MPISRDEERKVKHMKFKYCTCQYAETRQAK